MQKLQLLQKISIYRRNQGNGVFLWLDFTELHPRLVRQPLELLLQMLDLKYLELLERIPIHLQTRPPKKFTHRLPRHEVYYPMIITGRNHV